MRAFHRKGLSIFLLAVTLLYASSVFSKSKADFLSQECLPADGGPSVPVYYYCPDSSCRASDLHIGASLGKTAAITALGMDLFSVEYIPPSLAHSAKVQFSETHSGARRTFRLCPHPAGKIVVSVEPKHLLAGKGQQARIEINLSDSQDVPVPKAQLQVTSNIGKILSIRELGDGRYESMFEPPGDSFPQVAIIMVAWPDGARAKRVAVARAVIPITARLDLPGKTAPGTIMKMSVAGKVFGPVTADNSGSFTLPILVPPGYGTGRATSVDKVGNKKNEIVKLYLPETNQLGIWAYPRQVVAGTENACRILVTTIDKFGSPMDLSSRKKRRLKIKAERGHVQALRRISKGLFETYYVPPKLVGKGTDEINVVFPGGSSKSHANIKLKLLPGPASRMRLVLPELLAADGKTKGKLMVEVFDELGNHAFGQVVELDSDLGTLSQAKESSAGLFVSYLRVEPNPPKWRANVRASARNRHGSKPVRIELSSDSISSGQDAAVLMAVVVDRIGIPVAGQDVDLQLSGKVLHARSDAHGRVEFSLPEAQGHDPHSALLTSGDTIIKRVFWVGTGKMLRLLPIGLSKSLPRSKALVASGTIALLPPTDVILTIRVGEGRAQDHWRQVLVHCIGPDGKPCSGRTMKLSCSIGKVGRLREISPGVYEAKWYPGTRGWSKAVLSVFDVGSEVGAIAEVEE